MFYFIFILRNFCRIYSCNENGCHVYIISEANVAFCKLLPCTIISDVNTLFSIHMQIASVEKYIMRNISEQDVKIMKTKKYCIVN